MVFFKDRIGAAETSIRRLFSDLCINEDILKSRIEPQLIDDLMAASKEFYQFLTAYDQLAYEYTMKYDLEMDSKGARAKRLLNERKADKNETVNE